MLKNKKPTFLLQNSVSGENQTIPFKPGQSVLEALLQAKVEIGHMCGGMGSCTTCRVKLFGASLGSPRTEVELERAQERGFTNDERLACQLEAEESLLVVFLDERPRGNL